MKECLRRALRTFIQTAVGYAITDLSLYFNGVDFTDGSAVLNVLTGLAISAVSAGLAGAMNIQKGECKNG